MYGYPKYEIQKGIREAEYPRSDGYTSSHIHIRYPNCTIRIRLRKLNFLRISKKTIQPDN
jgi:hypothetical protein